MESGIVIIPTYNEIENIKEIVEAVMSLPNNFPGQSFKQRIQLLVLLFQHAAKRNTGPVGHDICNAGGIYTFKDHRIVLMAGCQFLANARNRIAILAAYQLLN